MKLGIALSGGGLWGAYCAGVLEGLRRIGIAADVIAGTGECAQVAAFYAAQMSFGDSVAVMKRLRSQGNQKSGLIARLSRIFEKSITSSEDRAEKAIRDVLLLQGIRNFCDLKITAAISTIDLLSARTVIFTSDSGLPSGAGFQTLTDIRVWTAVRSAMSYAGGFKPRGLEGLVLAGTDAVGGVPLWLLRCMGAERTIGLNFPGNSPLPSHDDLKETRLFGRIHEISGKKNQRENEEPWDYRFHWEPSEIPADFDACLRCGLDSVLQHQSSLIEAIYF